MTTRSPRRNGGFTLIEIIVTIVILAFVATMVASYMTSAVANSARPVNRVLARGAVQGIIEAINSDYRALKVDELLDQNTDGDILNTLQNHVAAGANSNEYYGATPYEYETTFMRLSGSNVIETSGQSNILKIRITVQDQTVITLFSN
ncbi:hypothetical protein JCM16814_24220 [Desulfobaculum senezii]